jgi:hypothetical protein
MKPIIVFLSIILSASLIYSQSSIVYDVGTNIDIGTNSDVCAAKITINGTYNGNGTFCNAPVAVETDTVLTPDKFDLSQNFPNPFNPSTLIKYQLPKSSHVTIKVYNVLGDEVAILVNEEKPAGNYEVNFSSGKLSSGTYFYRIQAGSFVETKKMILMK